MVVIIIRICSLSIIVHHTQELEDPGQEVVERIETISDILAENHQLRPAILQLQNFQYIGTNIGIIVIYRKHYQSV